jgi:hypothetical protein
MSREFNLIRFARRWLLPPTWLLAVSTAAFAGPPPWLQAAASQPTPDLAGAAPAVVLLNETVVTVEDGGRSSRLHREAIRILTPAGRAEANAWVSYVDKSDSVRGCEAWLIRAGKTVKLPRRHDWVDVVESDSETVYSEFRARMVSYADGALPGDVFGYETRVQGPMLFLQVKEGLGGRFPLVLDRFELQIPRGWALHPVLKGSATPFASVSPDGRVACWELRNRPYRPNEPWVPAPDAAEAELMVSINPAPGHGAELPSGFNTWGEAVGWVDRLNASQSDTDPALAAAVRKLVANCPDDLAKIRALGSHVQELRYAEVSRDIGIGFGYRARKGSEVLARGWGDCKDKAYLLRTMLREAGIRAYPTLARPKMFGDVYPEWPSPWQFNHVIVAIEVDATVALPAVLPVYRLGRLLFFDPTDPDTILGDLPQQLQGSNVLICAEGSEALTTLPALPVNPEYMVETKAEFSLSADGSVSGKRSFGGVGQAGAHARHWLRTTSTNDQGKKVGESLGGDLRGAVVTNVTADDDRVSGCCFVGFGFSAPSFVQFLQGGLMLVRLHVLNRDPIPRFVEKDRLMPVQIPPVGEHDEEVMRLPAGFNVDELPPKAVLTGPYGSYESSFECEGRAVVHHRMLTLTPGIVPVNAYADFQRFLSDVAKADRTAVVLRRSQ